MVRLFILMIIEHGFYTALASGSHDLYAELFPARGSIYLESEDGMEQFSISLNRDLYVMFADTREIEDDETAEVVAEKLAEVFGYDDEKKIAVFLQLNKRSDPYEPIEQKVEEDIVHKIGEMNLKGIHFISMPHRFYPEGNLAAQVVGFLGKDDAGNDVGRYGLEGYWNKELAGSGGFLEGVRSAKGSWIPLAGRLFEPAQDGVDLTLTIDRVLQYKSCEMLRTRQEEYGAQTASLIIMDPKTGAIHAMCSLPDFDPNNYGTVESANAYNNTTIFTPYEPGSVFKPVAMSAAINEDVLNPESTFVDNGSTDGGCTKPIQNADFKTYGLQTMTGVLEHSINTGMVYVVKTLGKSSFREYVERFGFGVKTGIELDSESSGTIQSLYENKKNSVDCYTATASFGQGLTVTPLQMVSAFAVIANGGSLMEPYIVKKVTYPNGKVEETKPKEIRKVLEKRTSQLVSGMLVRVIDNAEGSLAKVPGYYIAGKTGTAQIAGPGGYTNDFNHSFVGFGPVDDPKFVMIVKFEKPRRAYASTTAAPTFAEIAKFIMQYYHVEADR
ncbi:MAG: penicillin-binding protein 2 [Candidatus Magasanikbacteria bacterium]|nr:penicillin-binding protein 2 [Candidatus Magasanikbacteria bacterium]